MKKIAILALIGFYIPTASAALFSLSGNHRLGTNWFNNLDEINGTNPGASNSSSFIEQRLLLRPDILIDERFSIRSEWSLLNQNGFNNLVSAGNQATATNAGSEFGANQSTGSTNQLDTSLRVRYAYMKWNSDVGIFRAGRMPKGWGLGLLYDEGQKVSDDAATIVDRVGFEGQLGSLVLNFGFEKYQEGNIHTDIDDDEVYEGSVKYENEGSGVAIGLLYGRHIRLALSDSKQAGFSSSNDASFFARKEWETMSIAGEVASVSYDKEADVYGALVQYRFQPGNWDVSADGLYSSHSSDRAFIVHPNYRPFLILFRQSQGKNVGATSTRYGKSVGFDPSDSADQQRGALLGKVGAAYSFFAKKYKLGLVAGYAKLLQASANGGETLGIEADLHFDQQWYDNFSTGLTAGVFRSGNAFGPDAQLTYGLQIRSYLEF